MAWETALDRLVLQQIHRAESGDARPQEVQRVVADLHHLAPERAQTAFHLGYARTVLGVDLPMPSAGAADAQRWYSFGRLRGHDRRGEQSWVADLLGDPARVLELMGDPRIATQCLPLVMRALSLGGNFDLAIRAINYLSSVGDEGTEILVDAALSDLLTRLEGRDDPDDGESTLSLIQKCRQLESFGRLPEEVRAGYLDALGQRLLAVSEFEEACTTFDEAFPLANDAGLRRGRIALGGALATLRLHRIEELSPVTERLERDEAIAWLSRTSDSEGECVPGAMFVRGLLAYETGGYAEAEAAFDGCAKRLRRLNGRDAQLIARNNFFLASALLAGEVSGETARALRLMDTSLEHVEPDLESFYSVHETLKAKDRRLSLRFLDAVDVGRGTAPDQLLLVALEYLALGEAEPAAQAADRVLQVAVDLDQRIEAMRVLLTVHNMRGDRSAASAVFAQIRDLLMQRGAFAELETLLQNEEFVGQALDHLEIKCELVALYEEMEDREIEKATLQTQIARNLRARKDEESLQEAFAVLREVEIAFPELATDELEAIEKLLALSDAAVVDPAGGAAHAAALAERVGRAPRVLVVGGNERQRRHHPKFEALAADWKLDGEWLMANYSSPQKLVATVGERIQSGIDLLVLLHWNRHETTEPALELARKAGLPARTVHYAGFTSLQVCLADQLEKVANAPEPADAKGRKKARQRG